MIVKKEKIKKRLTAFSKKALSLVLSLVTAFSVFTIIPVVSQTEANAASDRLQKLISYYERIRDNVNNQYNSTEVFYLGMKEAGYTTTDLILGVDAANATKVKNLFINSDTNYIKQISSGYQVGDVIVYSNSNDGKSWVTMLAGPDSVYILDSNEKKVRVYTFSQLNSFWGNQFKILEAYRDTKPAPYAGDNLGNSFYANIRPFGRSDFNLTADFNKTGTKDKKNITIRSVADDPHQVWYFEKDNNYSVNGETYYRIKNMGCFMDESGNNGNNYDSFQLGTEEYTLTCKKSNHSGGNASSQDNFINSVETNLKCQGMNETEKNSTGCTLWRVVKSGNGYAFQCRDCALNGENRIMDLAKINDPYVEGNVVISNDDGAGNLLSLNDNKKFSIVRPYAKVFENEEFYARIRYNGDDGKTPTYATNKFMPGTEISLENKEDDNDGQIWKFIRVGAQDKYVITPAYNDSVALQVGENGSNKVTLETKVNGGNKQRQYFLLYNESRNKYDIANGDDPNGGENDTYIFYPGYSLVDSSGNSVFPTNHTNNALYTNGEGKLYYDRWYNYRSWDTTYLQYKKSQAGSIFTIEKVENFTPSPDLTINSVSEYKLEQDGDNIVVTFKADPAENVDLDITTVNVTLGGSAYNPSKFTKEKLADGTFKITIPLDDTDRDNKGTFTVITNVANKYGYYKSESSTIDIAGDKLADLGRKFYATISPKGSSVDGFIFCRSQDNSVDFVRLEYYKTSRTKDTDKNFIREYFQFEREEDGYYTISSTVNGTTYWLAPGEYNKKPTILFKTGSTNVQKWKLINHSGYYELQAYGTNGCLKVDNNGQYATRPYISEGAFTGNNLFVIDKQLPYYDTSAKVVDNVEAGYKSAYRDGDYVTYGIKGKKDDSKSVFQDELNFKYNGFVKTDVMEKDLTHEQKFNYNGKSYQIFNFAVTYAEAKQICAQKGGKLVNIATKEQNEAFTSKVKDAIGKDGYDKGWVYWVDENSAYKDWVESRNFNGEYSGLAVGLDGKFNYYANDNNNLPCGFICELEGEETTALDGKEVFWAYIKDFNAENYFASPYKYNKEGGYSRIAPTVNVIATDKEKRKQSNFWKFEKQTDGSYRISSCTLQQGYLCTYAAKDKIDAYPNASALSDKLNLLLSWKDTEDKREAPDSYWVLVKSAGGYKLRNKFNGKLIALNGDGTTGLSNTGSVLDIIETDLTIQADPVDVEMHLFNYGTMINEDVRKSFRYRSENNSNVQLWFSETQKYYVDMIPGSQHTINNLTPNQGEIVTESTLSEDGYPQISYTMNGLSALKGSLKYLFDPKMGEDTKGFVEGSLNTSDNTEFNFFSSAYNKESWLINSYNLFKRVGDKVEDSGKTFYKNSLYKSQHFEITDTRSLFTIDEDGYYSFDSGKTAAYFKPQDTGANYNKGTFQIFDYALRNNELAGNYYTGEKENADSRFTGSGNFFPFNLGHTNGNINYNEKGTNPYYGNGYSVDKNEGHKSDKTSVEYLYNNDPIDRWFGMTLNLDFRTTKDNMFNGKPMKYEFRGDDDVWVYIDGVLMLDISGNHGALNGYIDFKTGKVEYSNYYHKDSNGADVKNGLTRETYDITTNIYSMVKEAGKLDKFKFVSTDGSEIKEDGSNATLAPNENHNLKMFYLERGGSLSNCRINFNVAKCFAYVEKHVDKLNSSLSDQTDFKYNFKLYDKDGNSEITGEDFNEAGITYKIYDFGKGEYIKDASGNDEWNMTYATDGKASFTLKDNQKADISGTSNDYTFTVEEVLADGAPYDVKMQKSHWNAGNQAENQAQTKGYVQVEDYETGEKLGVNYNTPYTVIFTNSRNDVSDLTVKLCVKDGNETVKNLSGADYNFYVEYTYNNQKVEQELVLTGASADENGVMSFVIPNLPNGTDYKVYVKSRSDNARVYIDQYTMSNTGFVSQDGGDNTHTLVDNKATSGETGLKGTISATNNVVYTTMFLKGIEVVFHYYDRDDAQNGTPAHLNKDATEFKVVQKPSEELISSTATQAKKLEDLVTMAYNGTAQRTIKNVTDDYTFFATQKKAVDSIKEKLNPRSSAKIDERQTFENFSESSNYNWNLHFDRNSRAQGADKCEINDNQKWVTYRNSDNSEIDNATIQNVEKIDVWLYNEPRVYTVTATVGETTTDYKAYYNQRFGKSAENDTKEDSATEYLKDYGIPNADKYGYTGEEIVYDNDDFGYWSTDESGDCILATTRYYNYRATKNMHIYAKTTSKPETGVRTLANTTDYFTDNAGTRFARLNTIINPYSCAQYDKNITQVAVHYIVNPNIGSKEKLDTFLSYLSSHIDSETGKLKGISYKRNSTVVDVATNKYLTSCNRMQFTLRVKEDDLSGSLKSLAAVTAMKYKDKWILSSNVVLYQNGEGKELQAEADFEQAQGYSVPSAYFNAKTAAYAGVQRGDVEMNGDLTITDVTAIQKYLAGITTFNKKQELFADMNGDGNISIMDATKIQKVLAGMI